MSQLARRAVYIYRLTTQQITAPGTPYLIIRLLSSINPLVVKLLFTVRQIIYLVHVNVDQRVEGINQVNSLLQQLLKKPAEAQGLPNRCFMAGGKLVSWRT